MKLGHRKVFRIFAKQTAHWLHTLQTSIPILHHQLTKLNIKIREVPLITLDDPVKQCLAVQTIGAKRSHADADAAQAVYLQQADRRSFCPGRHLLADHGSCI